MILIATDTTEAPGRAKNAFKWSAASLNFTDVAYRYALPLLLVVEIVAFSIAMPDTFFTHATFANIVSADAILMILVLAVSVPMLCDEFDASVGWTLGLSMTLVAYLSVLKGWGLFPAIVATLAACLLVGMVNALFVVYLNINSFIVTLGTGTAIGGLTYLISNSTLITGVSASLTRFTTEHWFGMQRVVYYGLGLAVVLWFVYEHTPLGRKLLFVGAGREAARLGGLRVNRIRAGAFLTSALLAGAGGILLACQLGTADPDTGHNFLLPVFSAAFLGATTIKPGRVNAWGAVVAIYLLTTGITGLQLLGTGSWVQDAFFGSALCIGVAVSRLAERRLERRTQSAKVADREPARAEQEGSSR